MLRAQSFVSDLSLNFLDFGGVGDNSTDNAAAWAALDAYVNTLGSGDQAAADVYVPAGIYKMSAVTLTGSYIIHGAGDEGTEFRPMTSAQSHLFQFTGRVVQMRDFGILGWPTRTPADFALVGIITDGGEYEFTNYRVYNCVDGFWHKRGRRYNNHAGSIGVLGEGGRGIRLGGVDGAANALTAQSCVDNLITAQSWSGGIVTFTTTNAHGFAPYDYFIIYGASPSGYNGTFQAVSGTTGSTLRARLTSDPGASVTLGTMTVATFVATETTRVRRASKFNIYGSSPNGYNGQWRANTGSTGNTLVACLSSNPGTSTVLGTSSAARGWGAVTSETRIGPNLAIYSGSSSTTLQNLLGMSWSAGTVTFTTEIEHNMEVGDRFTVRNSVPTGYNGTFTATAVDERLVSAALVTDPELSPNVLTAQSWSGGTATFTTTSPHGLAAGDLFTISGSLPSGYSGTFTAITGTTGSTILATIEVDPGASTTLGNLIVYGEIYGRYNGTGILLDTDNGATVIENSETGSCDYAVRIADTLQLGDQSGDNYRGTGFLKLRGFTTGNCGTAGVSIEANGRSFKAFNCSFSAPGDADADGVYIDSYLASPQLTGCEWHYCRATGIRLRNAYSLTVKGSIMSDIGTRGGGTPGVGLKCETGAADVYFAENIINPDLQLNTSATMDYGVLLAADSGNDAFTGSVYAVNNTVLDMNLGDYTNLSTSGTLTLEGDTTDFVIAPPSSTAQQFADLVAAHDVVWITEPFDNTWTTTCDLSALDGKKILALPCGEPIITSSANPAIRVGGEDHRFSGNWWIECNTATVDKLCVEVASGSERHYWDTFKPDGWGIGMQGTKGIIREIVIDTFEPKSPLSYGLQFYSTDSNSEVGLIRVNRMYEETQNAAADNAIMFSIGPNVGSGGLFGFEAAGYYYGGKNALHMWANKSILTQSWASDVVTFTTEEPHGVQVGNEFVVAGSSPSGYNGTWTAITGTTDKTLKATLLSDPGASSTLGTFGPATLVGQQYADAPRSVRLENFTRRGGTNTSFKLDAGADVEFIGCKSDDPGAAISLTGQSWAANTLTFTTASDVGIRVGDYFYVTGSTGTAPNATAYNGTWLAITGTTGTSIKATSTTDPGASTVLGTIQANAHGLHIGRYFQGNLSFAGGKLHDHNGNGIRNEAIGATGVSIRDTLIYTSSNADKAGVWSGYYQDPACSNVVLENVSSGTSDAWRKASRTITFSGLPTAADTITFNGTAVTFRAAASLPNEVTIGADAAATAQNLVTFINTANYSPFKDITATLSGAVVTVIHYPGSTYGNAYTLTESAANVTVSGSPLSGGVGVAFQKYGFEGITDGLRNCRAINCNGNNNLSGAFSTSTPRTLPSGGGTGIANNDRSTVTISGAFPITWTVTASTSLTLPTSGTLAITGANTFTAAQIISVTDNSNAALRVTQLGTGDALRIEDSANPDSTPFVITGAGRSVFQDTTNRTFQGGAIPYVQINNTNDDASSIGLSNWTNTTTLASSVLFAKARGGTIGTHSAVASGTLLGTIGWSGSDGTAFIPAAEIIAEVDGTPGTNDMPARLVFKTTADGAAATTERARIDNKGNVVINTAAIATTATDGFLYVPTCAGTPTGTPTTYTGRAPIVVDTTNNKLYFYSGGAWRDAGP